MFVLRLALLGGACAACFLGTGAEAQEVAPSAGGSSVADLEQVVVTARRREERLQDVPVAVAAFTPEKLQQAQVTTARQLVGFVPSLNINSGNQRDTQRFAIRGQGATVGAGESVTVYFAEAPMSQYVAGGPGLYFDLENLQVLNGPQGTLFGRNTIGGAVLLTPRRPSDATEGFIQVGYGNYNNREVGAVLNYAPMPDVLRFRATAEVRRREGFTTQVSDGTKLDDIDYKAFRASMLFTPIERLENYLVANYVKSDTGGTGILMTAVNPTGPAQRTFGLANLNAELARQQQLGIRATLGTAPHWWSSKTLFVVNTTTLELTENLKLKNIASFSRVRASGGFDNDGTSFPLSQWRRTKYSMHPSGVGESRNEYVTEELQLQGEAWEDRLVWVLGGFYQNTYPYGFQRLTATPAGGLTITESHLNTTSSALFGQATLDFGLFSEALSELKLTAGYRYSWDTRNYTVSVWQELGANRPCTNVAGRQYPNCLAKLNREWSAPTYNISLDYKITPSLLVYATHRTGYKSGGFNVSANSAVPPAFGPEEVKDIEIGMKSDFSLADRPVRLNLALFRDKYDDIQRSVFVANPNTPGSSLTYLTNASKATIEGVEAQVTVRPTDRLQIEAVYSYLDATYDDYPNFLDASVNRVVNLGGFPLPFAPKHKYAFNVTYDAPLDPTWGELRLNANLNYQSKYLSTDQPQPSVYELGDYTLVGASARWSNFADTPVDVELYVTNLFNKKAIAAGQVFYYSSGTSAASFIEPRMFGVRLRYTFGEP